LIFIKQRGKFNDGGANSKNWKLNLQGMKFPVFFNFLMFNCLVIFVVALKIGVNPVK